MKRTFLNGDKELAERGERYLNSRIEDFEFFMEYSHCEDIDELIEQLRTNGANFREARQTIRQYYDAGLFADYGLGFDYVELGTFEDQEEDYFRFQLSWGGPSDEIRFYEDGTMEYIFLDWFVGVGFDVTGIDVFVWLAEWFMDCMMLNFEDEREKYDYYTQLMEAEEE